MMPISSPRSRVPPPACRLAEASRTCVLVVGAVAAEALEEAGVTGLSAARAEEALTRNPHPVRRDRIDRRTFAA